MLLRLSVSPLVLVAMLSGCAAGGAHPPAAEQPTAPVAQRIFVDPVTGDLRAPTQEERWQGQAAVQTPALQSKAAETPPRIVEYPDGTVGVFIRRPHHLVHAEAAPDGSIRSYCSDDAASQGAP